MPRDGPLRAKLAASPRDSLKRAEPAMLPEASSAIFYHANACTSY